MSAGLPSSGHPAGGPGSIEHTRVGRYNLRHAVARGGMATVYLAQLEGAHGFEQWVAIKTMHPHLAANRHFVSMFLDEAHLASRIRHPNACSVIDFGEEGGMPFIVMEYLHGETLASVARRGWEQGSIPLWVPARIIADAARGLHAAHELRDKEGELRNVVHRDVSPQNIFVLYDGFSKITDFGVAKVEGKMTETREGELKGKIAYMSPEQLDNKPLDRRSDIWALGVTLWETTVGKRLFRQDSAGSTAAAVYSKKVPDPRTIRADYPDDLAELVMATLHRDRSRRTPTAKELADRLEKYLHGTGRVIGADQLAEWMGDHFAERRSQRESLLRAPPEEVADEPIPVEEVSSGPSLGGGFSHSSVRPTATPPSRTSSPLMIGAIALLAALGGAVFVFAFMGGGSSRGDDPAANAAPEHEEASGNGEESEESSQASGIDEENSEPEVPSGVPETGGSEEEATAPEGEAGEGEPEEPEAPRRRGSRRPRRSSSSSYSSAAAPAASGAPGTLNLLTIPNAQVTLSGRSLGTTPLIGVSLPAGSHRLRLRPIDGGPARSITVRIRSGERTSQSVSLATLR